MQQLTNSETTVSEEEGEGTWVVSVVKHPFWISHVEEYHELNSEEGIITGSHLLYVKVQRVGDYTELSKSNRQRVVVTESY